MKSRILVTGLLAAGLCGIAQAEEQSFYAGSGLGLYYVDLHGVSFDETAPTLRVFGGYDLNDYVSFEAGYTNLFKASHDVAGVNVDLDGSALDLTVRPTFPVSDRFRAFGILGWSHYDFNVSASGGGANASADGSGNDLLYGLGADLAFADRWNLRGEWTAVDVSDADFGMFSVSASYSFR